MDKIAVLIPCYNESKTIKKVIADFKQEFPDATIYVYDNNSSDETVKIAKSIGAIVRHEYKQGKGNVIRRMFREIEAEVYILVDGDDTYPANIAHQMVDLIKNHNTNMVIGDRLSSTYYTENKRPFHNFGNSLMKHCINHLFGTNIKDIMTGYRAFDYCFVKTFSVLSQGFEIETEMTIHAVHHNLQIESIPVEYRDRPEGSISKLNTFSDGFKVIFKMLSLYKNYKPFVFFSSLALILVTICIAFFIPVLSEYLVTRLVPRVPTLIACGLGIVISVQLIFTGLIMQGIEQKNKQDFELEFIRAYSEYQKKVTK